MLFYLFKCTYLADVFIDYFILIKIGVSKLPLLSTIGKGIQMIFVDRFSKSSSNGIKTDNTLEKISEKVDSFENKKISETQ